MRLQSSHKPTSAEGAELIAADGKCIWIKCLLAAAGIGSNVSVPILRITNMEENNEFF
jgi:hypothetical protein